MTVKAKATATPALKLLVGQSAIEAALKSIFNRGQSLQADIHVAACSVLQHIGKHSDIRLAKDLLAACPEITRKNALREWLAKFGPIMFEGDAPVFVKGKAVKLGDAMATPFWKLVPEKAYEAIDLPKFMASMVKKLQRDQKETKVDHSQLIRKLETLTAAPTA